MLKALVPDTRRSRIIAFALGGAALIAGAAFARAAASSPASAPGLQKAQFDLAAQTTGASLTTVGLPPGPSVPPGFGFRAPPATATVSFDDGPAFEIKDFSFGIENPTTIGSATGGAGAGKVKFNEFTIKKSSDSATPTFFKNCVAGAHYGHVTVAMRKAGGDPRAQGVEFLRFEFGTVFTTKIDWSGPGDEGPEESITFVYGKIAISADQPDGGVTASGAFNTVDLQAQ